MAAAENKLQLDVRIMQKIKTFALLINRKILKLSARKTSYLIESICYLQNGTVKLFHNVSLKKKKSCLSVFITAILQKFCILVDARCFNASIMFPMVLFSNIFTVQMAPGPK